jgi:hypothetical protein
MIRFDSLLGHFELFNRHLNDENVCWASYDDVISADWWVLMTANAAGINGITWLTRTEELEIINLGHLSSDHQPALGPRGELWPVLLMCNP